MSKMECTLLEQNYLLVCPEGGEMMMQMAVQIVDEELAAIHDAGKVRSRERMAVLAALNLAYRLAEKSMAPPPAPLPAQGPLSEAGMVEALIARLENVLADSSST